MKRICLFLILIILTGAKCGDPYRKGMDLLDKGQYEQAARFFLEKTKENPEDPRAFNQLGFAYTRLKMYDKALGAYKKAVELKPDYYEAYLNAGTTCLYKLDPESASWNLRKAVEINPECEPCQVNLTWAFYHLSRFDYAQKHLDKAKQIGGDENKYKQIQDAIDQKVKLKKEKELKNQSQESAPQDNPEKAPEEKSPPPKDKGAE